MEIGRQTFGLSTVAHLFNYIVHLLCTCSIEIQIYLSFYLTKKIGCTKYMYVWSHMWCPFSINNNNNNGRKKEKNEGKRKKEKKKNKKKIEKRKKKIEKRKNEEEEGEKKRSFLRTWTKTHQPSKWVQFKVEKHLLHVRWCNFAAPLYRLRCPSSHKIFCFYSECIKAEFNIINK